MITWVFPPEELVITFPQDQIQILITPRPARHPLGPLGFECSQHRQTLRPTVDGTRSTALRSFELQKGSRGSSSTVQMARSEWLKGDPQVGHVS